MTWTQGSSEPAIFTFKRNVDDDQTFGRFTGFAIGDEELDAQWYDAKAGSVIVSVKPEYLATLSVGTHVVKAFFDDGDPATGTLVVAGTQKKNDEQAPVGADTSNPSDTPDSSDKPNSSDRPDPSDRPDRSGTPSTSASSSSASSTTTSSSARTPSTGDSSLSMTVTYVALALGALLLVSATAIRHVA